MINHEDSSFVNYSNSALIVWDLQYGITSKTLHLDSIITNTKKLIGACHKYGKPVFFSQSTGLAYDYQGPYIRYWIQKRGLDPMVPRMVEGSHDWLIRTELEPSSYDLVMKKTTHSFFIGTNLEQLLRNKGVVTLMLSGVSTEVGVETTARHAAQLGFVPVIVEDAVGSSDQQMHEASLFVMKKLFDVRKTDDITREISEMQENNESFHSK